MPDLENREWWVKKLFDGMPTLPIHPSSIYTHIHVHVRVHTDTYIHTYSTCIIHTHLLDFTHRTQRCRRRWPHWSAVTPWRTTAWRWSTAGTASSTSTTSTWSASGRTLPTSLREPSMLLPLTCSTPTQLLACSRERGESERVFNCCFWLLLLLL